MLAARIDGDVMQSVLAAIRSVDGTGDYTFDLSQPGQVHEGRMSTPETDPPFACVFEQEDGCWVVGWAPCDDYAEDWSLKTQLLCRDLLAALDSSPDPRSLSYFIVDGPEGFIPYRDGEPIGYPQAVIAVICTWEDHSS
tara:strand:- start:113 stop:529 length:417 start_codon:yes stop_codon:yes gene_type:complete